MEILRFSAEKGQLRGTAENHRPWLGPPPVKTGFFITYFTKSVTRKWLQIDINVSYKEVELQFLAVTCHKNFGPTSSTFVTISILPTGVKSVPLNLLYMLGGQSSVSLIYDNKKNDFDRYFLNGCQQVNNCPKSIIFAWVDS